MNKRQILQHVAMQTGLSKRQVTKVVNAFLGTTLEQIKANLRRGPGSRITLSGFGTFKVPKQKAPKYVGASPTITTGGAVPLFIPAGWSRNKGKSI